MPFIAQNLRKVIDKSGLAGLLDEGWSITPGDRCYVFYKEMVWRWKDNPRWTTAHEIYKKMRGESRLSYANNPDGFDDKIAEELAWQCFFYFHVLEYEKEKMEENGDIT